MASTSKHKSFDCTMAMTKFASRLVGLWPLDDRRITRKKSAVVLITLLIMWSSSIPYMFYATKDKEYFESINYTVVMSITIMKFFSVSLNSKTLKFVMLEMEHCWKKFERFSTENKKLMNHYMKDGKKACIICIIFVELSTTVHFVSELIQSLRSPSSTWSCLSLPYFAVYPFHTPCAKDEPFLFAALYAWQAYTILCLGAVFIGIDCLLMTSASHASGQLAAIGQSLRQFRPGRERLHHRILLAADKNGRLRCRRCCQCLGCIVEWHGRVLRYCKLVDETYNLLLLTEFMGSTLQFCFHSYSTILSSSHQNFIGVSSFFLYLVLFNFRFYMYCNVCHTISELSENIKRSLYETEWYTFPLKLVRSMMLCMLRANSPVKITAGKFFQLNRISYKNVIMTSASYVSVLLSLKLKVNT